MERKKLIENEKQEEIAVTQFYKRIQYKGIDTELISNTETEGEGDLEPNDTKRNIQNLSIVHEEDGEVTEVIDSVNNDDAKGMEDEAQEQSDSGASEEQSGSGASDEQSESGASDEQSDSGASDEQRDSDASDEQETLVIGKMTIGIGDYVAVTFGSQILPAQVI